MPESLESFVKKLQSEGVESGKDAAEKIKKEAKREAEKIHRATVEVSPGSVSELLSEMVNPDIQEIIDNVVGKMGKKSSNEKRTNEGNWKDSEGTAKGKKG